jgi:DNA-binding transcriptional MerR regulator
MNTEQETFTVQQVAAQTGLSEHTLRYYERIGLLLPITRTTNGHRRYSQMHLRFIGFVIKLRATGMPIEKMREYAALIHAGEGNEGERLRLLIEHREHVLKDIEALLENLAVIEFKIETYEEKQACLSESSVPAE